MLYLSRRIPPQKHKKEAENMNILHLKYATEIAKTGSLSKAAENLFVGQPNLSRAIKELEANLGITVFERSPKGMIVTPEGKEFLRHAETILKQIDEVEAIYREGTTLAQRISVSVLGAPYIAEAFADFVSGVNKNIRAQFLLRENSSVSGVIKDVLEGGCMLGIIRYDAKSDKNYKALLEEKGLNYELVAEFDRTLLMNENHPLSGRDKIYLGDLSEYTRIVPTESEGYFAVSEGENEEVGKSILLNDGADRLTMLMKNNDAYMWSLPMEKEFTDRLGLVQKKCEDDGVNLKDVLIYRKDYRLTQTDKNFITELCMAKRKCDK